MAVRLVKIIATALLMVVFVTAGQIQARIPESERTAAYECRGVTRLVHRSLDRLSHKQLEVLLSGPKGIQPFTRQMFDKLLSIEPNDDNKRLYDLVMEREAGVSNCHYYIIYNFARPFKKESFVVCDNKHAHYSNVELENAPTNSPRSLFKSLCEKYDTLEAYEIHAGDFIEETSGEQLRKKVALSHNSNVMKFLARYWMLLPLLALFEFFLGSIRYLGTSGEGVKLYCFGLYISCTILILSCVTLYYTDTPLPDFRAFGLLPDGSYPKEIHKLSDVILYVSFGWWGISILTLFTAGEEKGLRMLALAYVIFAPLALSLSEQPFGGDKFAFPMLGSVLIVVNAFYIRSWASKPANDKPQNPTSPPFIDLPPVQQ